MKSILAFAFLAAVMYVCGLEKSDSGVSNTAQAPAKSSPAPAATPNKQALTDELVKLEKEITEAALNGDITLLARSTTDDFELTGVDGKVQNKVKIFVKTPRKTVKISGRFGGKQNAIDEPF